MTETDTDVILDCSNRYSNNGAPIAMILCAKLKKQCVSICFSNYFLFTVTENDIEQEVEEEQQEQDMEASGEGNGK